MKGVGPLYDELHDLFEREYVRRPGAPDAGRAAEPLRASAASRRS